MRDPSRPLLRRLRRAVPRLPRQARPVLPGLEGPIEVPVPPEARRDGVEIEPHPLEDRDPDWVDNFWKEVNAREGDYVKEDDGRSRLQAQELRKWHLQ